MASQKPSRSEIKKAQLLGVATELFLAEGYDAVSVDAIVARAGGTKTNVYKHFGGKAGLFEAVIKQRSHESLRYWPGEDVDGMEPEQALCQLGRRFLADQLGQQAVRLHRLIVAESTRFPGPAKRWFKLGPDQSRDCLALYFAELQEADRLRKLPPRRLAGMFLGMLSGELLLRQMVIGVPPPGNRELHGLVDDVVRVFLYGAAPA